MIVIMDRCFGDVDYFGITYRDAELINGSWYFYDSRNNFAPFLAQWRVRPLEEPRIDRRVGQPTVGAGDCPSRPPG